MQQVRKRILVLDPDTERGPQIVSAVEAEDHFGYHLESSEQALSQIYNDPPDLIVLSAAGDRWKTFLRSLKGDSVFGHLTVLCMFEREMVGPTTTFLDLPIDDFLFLPLDLDELRLRIRLAIDKSGRYLDANPLSRLPGNFTIIQTVQERIDSGTPFAFSHIDIDNFKPFNDRYGFTRGDEIIRMCARVLVNVVRNFPDGNGFVGHIGGDDFVLIINSHLIEPASRQVITHFDMLAATFYDDEDRLRGYIDSVDRQGNPRRFPLISLSISAVDSTRNDFNHFGQYSAAANEVKKKVKQMDGSNFMIDRRREKGDDPVSEENGLVAATEEPSPEHN